MFVHFSITTKRHSCRSSFSSGNETLLFGSTSCGRAGIRAIRKRLHEKTFKILSRVIEGKQDRTGVVTSVVDGVSYLQEFHTSNARFILQNRIQGSK
jgi:hypothetical protein